MGSQAKETLEKEDAKTVVLSEKYCPKNSPMEKKSNVYLNSLTDM